MPRLTCASAVNKMLHVSDALWSCMSVGQLEWYVSSGLVDYQSAVDFMVLRVEDIVKGNAPEMIWLLEHPPVYTAGTSAKAEELLEPLFPVVHTTRGGKYSYHGPGQRVVYVLLNLKQRGLCDVRFYVSILGAWIVNTLRCFMVKSRFCSRNVGVWVEVDGQEKKIAACGIRVRKWVTYHGFSINICPDLTHYAGIVPCGISGYGITSLQSLGLEVLLGEFDAALRKESEVFFATKGQDGGIC